MTKLLPLVVFDMDGTIIQSNIDYFGTRQKIWEILKGTVSKNYYEEIVGSPRSIIELVDLLEINDETNTKMKLAWEIIEKSENEGYEDAKVNEDVYETLEFLKTKGYTLTIFTNNSRKLTNYGLEKFNLQKYFDFVLTRDEVKNTKPHPEGLEITMRRFSAQNSNVVFVGDSWIDAETAVNARVKFIYFGLEGSSGTRRKVIKPDHTIEFMKDLIPIVEKLR